MDRAQDSLIGTTIGLTPRPARLRWMQVGRPGGQSAAAASHLSPAAGGERDGLRDWPAHLPDDVEVVSVQLPGGEPGLASPPIDSMEQLVDQLLGRIGQHFVAPSRLGHSMGAVIAFELAVRLRTKGCSRYTCTTPDAGRRDLRAARQTGIPCPTEDSSPPSGNWAASLRAARRKPSSWT